MGLFLEFRLSIQPSRPDVAGCDVVGRAHGAVAGSTAPPRHTAACSIRAVHTNQEVAAEMKQLSGLRTVASDSLYDELAEP